MAARVGMPAGAFFFPKKTPFLRKLWILVNFDDFWCILKQYNHLYSIPIHHPFQSTYTPIPCTPISLFVQVCVHSPQTNIYIYIFVCGECTHTWTNREIGVQGIGVYVDWNGWWIGMEYKWLYCFKMHQKSSKFTKIHNFLRKGVFFGKKKAPAGMPTLAANDFSQFFCSINKAQY